MKRMVVAIVVVSAVVASGCSTTKKSGDTVDALIQVGPVNGATTEAGGQASFTVVLSAKPKADVTVAVASSDVGEGTATPATLTFTALNFDAPQTVAVTGVDDDAADGAATYSVALGVPTTTDARYLAIDPADVSVVNVDDETAGITVTPITGATTEAGGQASFTVVLSSQPSADVVVNFDSNDTTEGTVASQSLTFTNLNWNAPEAVAVTGVNDNVADGSIVYEVAFTSTVSTDAAYAALTPANVPLTNIDDESAGVTVSPISGATTEGGGQATFTVVLNSQPTADVTINFNSNNATEGTVDVTSLLFTTVNYAGVRTVTVTGEPDDIADGNQSYAVAFGATTSADAKYSALTPGNVPLSNIDDDSAGITVSAMSGPTTEPGGQATFSVVLNSQPAADVTLSFGSSDMTEGTAGVATLTFTDADWDVAQPVAVTGVDDVIIDGNQPYAIVFGGTISGDPAYAAITPMNVPVTNNDDELAVAPRFAYVANSGDGTVSIFTVNAATGQWRANGYVFAGTNPRSVTVDPSGKFAYVANAGSNNVSAYTINASSGALTSAGAPVAAETAPYSVTVDPLGRFAYVANTGSNTISAYTINTSTGALTSVGAAVASGATPRSITVDPSGKFVYVVNNNSHDVSAYTINASTGALTSAGAAVAAGNTPYSVTVDPTGKFAYVANNNSFDVSAYTIDASTGVLTSIGTAVAAGSGPISVTVDPSGKFAYVANINSNNLSAYTINVSTGALTSVGAAVAAGTNPYSLTVDPSGKFASVANISSNDVSAYTINATTGALTSLGTVRARSGPAALAMTQGTAPVRYTPKFAYAANNTSGDISAYTIDANTGALTSVGAPIAAGTGPISVTVVPSGKFAYVANFNSSNVSAYTINASTGALTSVGAAVGAGTNPRSVTVDPSGKFAYVANTNSDNVSAYTIDASTGALTAVGAAVAAGSGPISVTVDPSGKFAYVANFNSNDVSAYTIDAGSGALSSVGAAVGAGSRPFSVTVDPSGKFVYVPNQSSNDVSVYTIDAGSGALSSVGAAVPAGSGPFSVTVDPSGKFAYVANLGSSNVSVYAINAATGALTSVGAPVSTGTNPVSVTVDPSGKFAYVANLGSSNVSVYAINAATGALTSVGAPVSAGTNPYSVTTTGTIQ